VYREIVNHQSLRHPNIIQFIEVRVPIRSRYLSIVCLLLPFVLLGSSVVLGVKKDFVLCGVHAFVRFEGGADEAEILTKGASSS